MSQGDNEIPGQLSSRHVTFRVVNNIPFSVDSKPPDRNMTYRDES